MVEAMNREDQEAILRWAFREEHLAITEHARIEMAMESVSTNDVIAAGSAAEVVEEDRDRPQGLTKVVLATRHLTSLCIWWSTSTHSSPILPVVPGS